MSDISYTQSEDYSLQSRISIEDDIDFMTRQ
jgi:hypothetical protein